jgi:DNA helicase HerA-like ATPase
MDALEKLAARIDRSQPQVGKANVAPDQSADPQPLAEIGPDQGTEAAIAICPKQSPESAAAPKVMEHSQRRLGRIVSIQGTRVLAQLEDAGFGQAGEGREALTVGALVKIIGTKAVAYALIDGIAMTSPSKTRLPMLELQLVGETPNDDSGSPLAFRRGLSEMPTIQDAVFAATHEDLASVFAFPGRPALRLGAISQDSSLPAWSAIDDLLGKHFAVIGNTGAGKSCTVALILRRILEKHGQGHVVLLDLHDEYGHAFNGLAHRLDAKTLQLPYWLLNFEEMKEIIVGKGGSDAETEASVLNQAILQAKTAVMGRHAKPEAATLDAPVPYRISDALVHVQKLAGEFERPGDAAPYLRVLSRLQRLASDPRFAFMQSSLRMDNLAAILGGLFRVPVDGKPITIVDLSEIPSEILNVVVSLICRLAFDFALHSDRKLPLLVVCEEAHRYAPRDSRKDFEQSKRSLARIAKEGRKYGVALCVVSQRPSELDAAVLSQCNTVFAMRLSNRADQEFVKATLTDSAFGLVDALPALGQSEAVAVGDALSLPMRLRFDQLPPDQQPMSATASFATAWKQEYPAQGLVEEIVRRWRHAPG